MRFAVGYQLAEPGEESFVALVRAQRAAVAEVYFAWPGHPSGRSPLGATWPAEDDPLPRFEADLVALRALDVPLTLLFNANCYGGAALSLELEAEVVRVLRRLHDLVGGVAAVTTTSPAIAHLVGRHFPQVRRQASINMRIGTIAGMELVSHLFDFFYVQRDYNRDLAHLRTLAAWAGAHGKQLGLLANSGCLRHCAGQTFHDNLVAHEAEVSQTPNISGFMPYMCWQHLRARAHWPTVLQATWIRPEDLHHYAALFPVVKLATRLHQRPDRVLQAYATGRYAGNVLDLMEPGYAPAFAPYVLDNTRFPPEWFARTSTCDRQCHTCTYCASVLKRLLVELPRG